MKRYNLSVSLVIPVYNEADQLDACLSAIAAQDVMPSEVIVVDNNSTDGTTAVAERYSFVKLIHEPRQGVVYARSSGFDKASGDIIARIDADSILPANWTTTLIQIFQDTNLEAVSGSAQYYNVAFASIFNTIDLFFRRRLQRQLKDRVYLWGANMAIRRRAWQRVRPNLCMKGGLHEDYDLAIHLQEIGGLVKFDDKLQAAVSSRRIDVGYLNFMRYVLVSPNTYAQHGIRQRWHMYEVAAVCAIGYIPARLLHRGYNPQTDRFSWVRLFAQTPGAIPRVDPTSHVA